MPWTARDVTVDVASPCHLAFVDGRVARASLPPIISGVCRTLRISCEAVPPSISPAGAQGGTSGRSTGAALSFVSCIRLFDCLVILTTLRSLTSRTGAGDGRCACKPTVASRRQTSCRRTRGPAQEYRSSPTRCPRALRQLSRDLVRTLTAECHQPSGRAWDSCASRVATEAGTRAPRPSLPGVLGLGRAPCVGVCEEPCQWRRQGGRASRAESWCPSDEEHLPAVHAASRRATQAPLGRPRSSPAHATGTGVPSIAPARSVEHWR